MCVEVRDGVIDFTLRIVTKADLASDTKCSRDVAAAEPGALLVLIEEANVAVAVGLSLDPDAIESALNKWLEGIAVRGASFSSKEVLKKLKRLGFREKSTEGSHVHLASDERKGKVTVPVHGGTLKKGTLKSILNQAGIDLQTLTYA